MANRSKFTFTNNLKSPIVLNEKLNGQLAAIMLYWDGPIETAMKLGASWTDRTGNARSGLRAEYVTEGFGNHQIVMSYSVDYGIWLEIANDGDYSIIGPTIPVMGPKVMQTTTKLLDRLG